MLANPLTKSGEEHQTNHVYERGARWRLTYGPTFQSAKKRKKEGVKMLADGDGSERFGVLFNKHESIEAVGSESWGLLGCGS